MSVVNLGAGPFHQCVILADGNVRCWGSNDSGQLGYGDTSARPDPLAVRDVPLF